MDVERNLAASPRYGNQETEENRVKADNPQPDRELTIAELQREAHRLIDQLAYRPGAAKLLLGTLVQLRMFADYKGDRKRQIQQRIRK